VGMRRPQYIEIRCKSALNRVQGMPFTWSLNPYRGCVHACHYCYARASHTFYDLNADEDFETQIFVKVNIAEVLRGELARPSWCGESIALGTATDCYQPAEGRFRLTRRILEVCLARHQPLSIVTKSTLILRDRDLLAELAQRAPVRIFITVTTLDPALWKALEPGTPPPLQRLRVLRELRAAGIRAGVLLAPILPGLTDSVASLDGVLAAAAEHGAAFVSCGPLRLAPLVKEHYLGVIGARFPDLLSRYERAYSGANAPPAYRERLDARLAELRRKYHFAEDAPDDRERRRLPRAGANPEDGARARQLELPMFPGAATRPDTGGLAPLRGEPHRARTAS
ncbi:MAG TPA: radical SAM protein, partial [Chloroflexota bacterium]|nr:radical SAM protein [Chloroflexota bacterium]